MGRETERYRTAERTADTGGFRRLLTAGQEIVSGFRQRVGEWIARRPGTERTYSAGGLVVAPLWAAGLTAAVADELVVAASMVPLQTGSDIGGALCQLGAGAIITAGLYIASIALAYLAIGDLFSGFKNRRSKSSSSKGQAGGDFGAGAFKMVGAVVIGGFPVIANAIGFTLLSCVNPIRLITG